MDIFGIAGIIVGVTFILVAQAMEGGNAGQLMQVTAAMIVFGGTAGAVITSFPNADLKIAMGLLKDILFPPSVDVQKLIVEIVG